jgi:hypothetical protein
MMNEQDTKHLLAYLQAADGRKVAAADIAFWMETMPNWLDLDTAKAAVRMFFTEPERNAGESTWFTTRHLIRCAKAVRRQREIEKAREAAKRPAIEAAYTPPAEGWRARVPGGWPEDAEGPAERPVPAPEFTEAQMAENRAKLAAMFQPKDVK